MKEKTRSRTPIKCIVEVPAMNLTPEQPRSTAYYYGDLERVKSLTRRLETSGELIERPIYHSLVLNSAHVPVFQEEPTSPAVESIKKDTYSTAGTITLPEVKEKEPLLAELEVVGRIPLTQLEGRAEARRGGWYLCCPGSRDEEISRESSWRYSSLRPVTAPPQPSPASTLGTTSARDATISLRIERDRLRRQLACERARASQASRQHDARLAELHGVIAELLRRRENEKKGIPEEDDVSEACDSTTQPAGELDNEQDRSKTEHNSSSITTPNEQSAELHEEAKPTTETSDYVGRSDSMQTEEQPSDNLDQCLDSGQGLDIKDLELDEKPCDCRLKELRISENSLLTSVDSLERNLSLTDKVLSCRKCVDKGAELSVNFKKRKVSKTTDESFDRSVNLSERLDDECASCHREAVDLTNHSCDMRSCVTSDLLNSEERLNSDEEYNMPNVSSKKNSSSVAGCGRFSPAYGYSSGAVKYYAETSSPAEARLASRVRLRKVSDQRMSEKEVESNDNKYSEMLVEQISSDLRSSSHYEEAMQTQNAHASAALTVAIAKCNKLEADVELLQASLAHAKDNAERLALENARHESASVELCRALRAADRALETYDVLLALAEANEKELPVAESVALQLLKRLDSEADGVPGCIGEPLMSLGPWKEHHSDGDSGRWSQSKERRIREHAARLKALSANIRQAPPDLFCYCTPEDEITAHTKNQIQSLDIEAAVITQEVASLRFEKAKSLNKERNN